MPITDHAVDLFLRLSCIDPRVATLTSLGDSAMPVEQQCPACGNGQGLARRVSTVPGRIDIVVVDMVCQSCSHQWRTEYASPTGRPTHANTSSSPLPPQ
jgi:hypothetical protein